MSRAMREPACWEMSWSEVAVFDGNANALGIEEASLMDRLGRDSLLLHAKWQKERL